MEKINELCKLPDENYHKYIWRIDNLIQSGKYANWKEITPIVNKELFNDDVEKYRDESAYRKSAKYARDFYEAGVFGSKSNDEDEYFKELQIQKNELQKERYKLQATKLEMQRKLRQDSRFELFYENVENAKDRLIPPKFERHIIPKNEKAYVLGFGDIHYGATFTSINNTYSREECKRRFDVLLDDACDYVSKNEIYKLKVINVADSIQGILRMSDLQLNDIPVVECVVEISRIIATFLNELSSMCEIEYYHVCNANHSQTRNLGSKASELATEDMEKIIANYISDLLADNECVNVIFDTSTESIDFNIFDFDCFAEHGHRIKNIQSYLRDKSIINRKMYSYGFVGHTHSSQEIIVGEENNNNVEMLIIPSMVGSDPYSDTLNLGSKAMAKIFEFDKVYGHVGSKNFILN